MTYPCRLHILLIAVVVGLSLFIGGGLTNTTVGPPQQHLLALEPRCSMANRWRAQDRKSVISKNLADMGAAGAATGITRTKGILHITSSSLRNVATGWVAASRGPARRNAFNRWRWP